jgi:hypothetical protein
MTEPVTIVMSGAHTVLLFILPEAAFIDGFVIVIIGEK